MDKKKRKYDIERVLFSAVTGSDDQDIELE